MNIAIIGTGNVGQGISNLLKNTNHRVVFGSREVSKSGLAYPVKSPLQAVQQSDVVVVAIPFSAISDLTPLAEDLAGKVVIDATNPLAANYMSLTTGFDTSAGEQVAELLPKSKVVKAFNTIMASQYSQGGRIKNTTPSQVFCASDDQSAKETVMTIAKDMGLEPVDVGSLSNSRYLEPLAELQIQLAYGLGLGTDLGFKLVR